MTTYYIPQPVYLLLLMRCLHDDVLENFLDVSSAQNSKKSERVTRASFVDYVSSLPDN